MTIEAVDPLREAEALGDVLHACVHAGTSVHFTLPFTRQEAAAYWRGVTGRVVLAAREDERIVGTVSLVLDTPPNQGHRAPGKMLVSPGARRREIARSDARIGGDRA